ncbi:hypothetical protein LCGC14_1113080 [marine sediment metagenome]|uniref:Uncharacterized protein n=1 Tax=marine sediment metagenome TaxID=412755 RepID=A0A0F9MU34_9ZZZZ
MNQSRFQVRLDEAYTKLTPKAVEFLECRRTVNKDIKALNITQLSRTSVSRWKQIDAFQQAYWLVTEEEPKIKAQRLIDAAQVLEMEDAKSEDASQEAAVTSPVEDLLLVGPVAIAEFARQELARLASQHMPSLFARLWEIVEDGKHADALRAAESLMKLMDINPQTMNPEEMDEVKRKVIEWTKLKINKSPSIEEVREEIGELNES